MNLRVLKEKKKAEKIFVDSQEKAFWATIRPGVRYFLKKKNIFSYHYKFDI